MKKPKIHNFKSKNYTTEEIEMLSIFTKDEKQVFLGLSAFGNLILITGKLYLFSSLQSLKDLQINTKSISTTTEFVSQLIYSYNGGMQHISRVCCLEDKVIKNLCEVIHYIQNEM